MSENSIEWCGHERIAILLTNLDHGLDIISAHRQVENIKMPLTSFTIKNKDNRWLEHSFLSHSGHSHLDKIAVNQSSMYYIELL